MWVSWSRCFKTINAKFFKTSAIQKMLLNNKRTDEIHQAIQHTISNLLVKNFTSIICSSFCMAAKFNAFKIFFSTGTVCHPAYKVAIRIELWMKWMLKSQNCVHSTHYILLIVCVYMKTNYFNRRHDDWLKQQNWLYGYHFYHVKIILDIYNFCSRCVCQCVRLHLK